MLPTPQMDNLAYRCKRVGEYYSWLSYFVISFKFFREVFKFVEKAQFEVHS